MTRRKIAKSRSDSPSYPVSSVDNALRLLDLFGTDSEVRIASAGRELGISDSTAHRLMQMLVHHDYARQDHSSRAYLPGPKLVRIGLAVVASSNLRSVSHPWLEWLVDQVHETVHLIELQGDMAVFVDSVETTRALRIGARTGQQLPAHATAAGKVILAALPSQALRRVLPNEKLPAITPMSCTSRTRLEDQLVQVRRRGYATNFRESETDLHAVAVPVVDQHGTTRAAIAVSAPATRLKARDAPALARSAKEAASQITAALHT